MASDVITFIYKTTTSVVQFVNKVIEKKRLPEFFISTPLLFLSYYVIFKIKYAMLWYFLIPAGIYALYWHYLFMHPKKYKIPVSSYVHWADEDWWWALNGWEFEEEVAKVFEKNGYKAIVTKKTGDGGIDILMFKDKKKIIVQSKHFINPVSVSYVRELNGLKEDFQADELIMVASSGLTRDGYEFSKNKPYYKEMNLQAIMEMASRV